MKRTKPMTRISSADAQMARYLDGECSPEARLAFEKRLEQSPDLARTLDEFGRIGDLLRDAYQEDTSSVDFSDFWSGVEAGIQALPAGAGGTKAHGERRGVWAYITGWLGVNAWRPIATAAVAAAAALTVVLPRAWERDHDSDAFVASNDTYIQDGEVIEASPDDVLSARNLTVAMGENRIQTEGVEVSQVSEGASVYLVNGATIIWVDDSGEAEGTAI